jgi:hypothetical protein
MITEPGAKPVMTPVAGVIIAMVVLLLAHVPPAVISAREAVRPSQTDAAPSTGFIGFTAIALDAEQLPMLYIIVATPNASPVTVPVAAVNVTIGLTVLHVPGPTASVNVTESPWHTLEGPAIAAGLASTVNVALAEHPVGNA